MIGDGSDRFPGEALRRALELTEEALGQVSRIAIEEIRDGVESSNHVVAAERDMRSALRQLVLAERELRSGAARRALGEVTAGDGQIPLLPRAQTDG